jgi:general secretion pathway protein E
MRLLERQQGVVTLTQLGMDEGDGDLFRRLLGRTSGIVLVTGPTGSGKTTTLYAALNHLNSPEKNIITIEDPIEYQLLGVGQIQVNPKIDLTFANGLRSILRQDPDIVMVGEIRDSETAEVAMQASLTGHLVLSTLHTNDSATAVTRLVEMGIEPYLVSSSLAAVLAQRLVRVICPHCREEYAAGGSRDGMKLPEKLYRGRGCDKCFHTGSRGRIGIYELLPIGAEVAAMITRRATAREIKEYAVGRGMRTLRDDGLAKAAAGITTLEEVLRVTQEEYADLPL